MKRTLPDLSTVSLGLCVLGFVLVVIALILWSFPLALLFVGIASFCLGMDLFE